MRILVLLVLAIIAYLLYKKFTSNNQTGNPTLKDDSLSDDSPGQLSHDTPSNDNQSDMGDKTDNADQTDAIKGNVVAAAGAAATSVTAAKNALGSTIPNTGNRVADIQEMLKVLNLRPSDAPRLSLTAEQYTSLKSGQAGDLSADVLDNVMGRLTAMM